MTASFAEGVAAAYVVLPGLLSPYALSVASAYACSPLMKFEAPFSR